MKSPSCWLILCPELGIPPANLPVAIPLFPSLKLSLQIYLLFSQRTSIYLDPIPEANLPNPQQPNCQRIYSLRLAYGEKSRHKSIDMEKPYPSLMKLYMSGLNKSAQRFPGDYTLDHQIY